MRIGPAFLQTFVVQVIQSVASITTGILIARGLGPAGQGRYAVFAASVTMGVVLGSFGQFESNVLSSGGRASKGRALLTRSVLQALAVGLALLVTSPAWNARMGGVLVALAFVVVLTLEIQAQLIRGINLGQHYITGYNLSALIQRVAYLTLVVALSLAGGLRLPAVLLSWASATLMSVLLIGWLVWRRSPRLVVNLRSILEDWRLALSRGLRAAITLAFTTALLRCDIWMVAGLLGVQATGQMSVAISLAEWLWYVPYILGTILFTAVAADPQTATGQICRGSRAIVALLLPVAVLLVITGGRLVTLIYGSAYAPAAQLFVILVPGMTALAIHIVVDSFFAGRGFPAISVIAAGGALVMKVGLNLLVIPRYGLIAAPIVTSVVYTLLLVVKVIAFRLQTGRRISELLVPTWSDVRGNTIAAVEWLRGRVGGIRSGASGGRSVKEPAPRETGDTH